MDSKKTATRGHKENESCEALRAAFDECIHTFKAASEVPAPGAAWKRKFWAFKKQRRFCTKMGRAWEAAGC